MQFYNLALYVFFYKTYKPINQHFFSFFADFRKFLCPLSGDDSLITSPAEIAQRLIDNITSDVTLKCTHGDVIEVPCVTSGDSENTSAISSAKDSSQNDNKTDKDIKRDTKTGTQTGSESSLNKSGSTGDSERDAGSVGKSEPVPAISSDERKRRSMFMGYTSRSSSVVRPVTNGFILLSGLH